MSTDCSPEQLLEYLQGEGAAAASTAAVAQGRARQEEEELLGAASDALGTRYVMRMVSRYRQPDINRSLQKLIATAGAVRAAFDLSGMSQEPDSATCALKQKAHMQVESTPQLHAQNWRLSAMAVQSPATLCAKTPLHCTSYS